MQRVHWGTNIEDEKISADKDELKLKNFRGREDFCGCEEVSEKERNVIMNYLTGEILSGSVWEGERFKIFGIDFCDLIFGNALKGNIIDCYMKIATFLVGYMRIMFNYRMDKKVNHVFCRQQGADLNCGIYTCLWAECYARDDDEAWNYEKVCTINSFRARIAATILSDDNGLFGKDK
ncbi:uncharacterized protein [Primulina huaijiensis]|uniref:uncharacterized protein n=1 Tax=Primulina huaijiensis TaxID=1492673 RepID=UPI003CC73FE8